MQQGIILRKRHCSALGDTSGWGDDCAESPVVEGWETNPGDHAGGREEPASHVTSAVESSFGS